MAAALCNGAAKGLFLQARLICRKQLSEFRFIKKNHCSTKAADGKSLVEQQKQISRPRTDPSLTMANTTVPSPLQRRILVHFKIYPNVEAIPDRVSWSTMNKVMSRYRIKVSMMMMVTTLVLCFLTAWYGKTHMRETSLVEVNLQRHKFYQQEKDFTGSRLALVTGVHMQEPGQAEKEEK